MTKKTLILLTIASLTLTACTNKVDNYVKEFNEKKETVLTAENDKKSKVLFLLLNPEDELPDSEKTVTAVLDSYFTLEEMNQKKYTVVLAYEDQKEDPIAVFKNGEFTVDNIEERAGLSEDEDRPDPREYFEKIIQDSTQSDDLEDTDQSKDSTDPYTDSVSSSSKDSTEDTKESKNSSSKNSTDSNKESKNSKNSKDEKEETTKSKNSKDSTKESTSSKDDKDSTEETKDSKDSTDTVKKQTGIFEKSYGGKALTYRLKSGEEITEAQSLKAEVLSISENALEDLGEGYTVEVKDSYSNIILEVKDGEIVEDIIEESDLVKSENKSIVTEKVEREGVTPSNSNSEESSDFSKDDTTVALNKLNPTGTVEKLKDAITSKDSSSKSKKENTKESTKSSTKESTEGKKSKVKP